MAKPLREPTYSIGLGERSQADTDDLNVPLALECELVGLARWLDDIG